MQSIHIPSALLGLSVAALRGTLPARQVVGSEKITCRTPEREGILSHMSIVHLEDGSGDLVDEAGAAGASVRGGWDYAASGGRDHATWDCFSSVSGGDHRPVLGRDDRRAGTLLEDA